MISSADDTGALSNRLAPHITGNPLDVINNQPSAVHTMIIIFGALALLFVMAFAFRKIRM